MANDQPTRVGFLIHFTSDDPQEVKGILGRNLDRHQWAKPIVDIIPAGILCRMLPYTLPALMKPSKPTRVISTTGASVEIIFGKVPMTPSQFMSNPFWGIARSIKVVEQCHELGAKLVGLGAFTSIVGGRELGGGIGIADAVNPDTWITTGNSLTAISGVYGLLELAERLGFNTNKEAVTVIGANGSIGRAAAKLLAEYGVAHVLLTDKPGVDLSVARADVGDRGQISTLVEALSASRLVLTATSSTGSIDLNPDYLQSGTVICDLARPRDIGVNVIKKRPLDILVIDGALLRLPEGSDPLSVDLGLGDPYLVFGCIAETLTLGLSGMTNSNYSIGRKLDIAQLKRIHELSSEHGIIMAGYRSQDHPVTNQQIEAFRHHVRR